MRGVILTTLFFSFTIYGSCNHTIVDKDPRFACVTVKNESQKNIAVSSENGGFNLPPGLSGESMLWRRQHLAVTANFFEYF